MGKGSTTEDINVATASEIGRQSDGRIRKAVAAFSAPRNRLVQVPSDRRNAQSSEMRRLVQLAIREAEALCPKLTDRGVVDVDMRWRAGRRGGLDSRHVRLPPVLIRQARHLVKCEWSINNAAHEHSLLSMKQHRTGAPLLLR